jgi:hypothetical protein
MRQLALLLLLYICSSCEKRNADDDKYWGHVPLDSSIYTYLFQPEGSILVFQDSLTGDIDTLHVYESVLDTFNVTNDAGKLIYHGESWVQKERHSHTGYQFWMDSRSRNPRYFTNYMIHKYWQTDRVGNTFWLFAPFSVFLGSTLVIDDNSRNKIANYYDSITFDSTYYHKVYTILTIGDESVSHTDNLYYYAKGYGLIRWEELTHQKVWKRLR